MRGAGVLGVPGWYTCVRGAWVVQVLSSEGQGVRGAGAGWVWWDRRGGCPTITRMVLPMRYPLRGGSFCALRVSCSCRPPAGS